MAEKKKKTTKKKTAAKKPAAKKTAAKKPSAKKAGAKKPSKKKKSKGMRIVRAVAEKRQTQEEGSIAPPTTHLVDAFAKFRSAAKKRPASPSVMRLPAGGSLPKPPAPPPKPVPAKPAAPPAPAAPGAPKAPAAPVSQAPAAPPAPAQPPVQAPATAEPPAEKKSAVPEPKATYSFDTPTQQRPVTRVPLPPARTPGKPPAKPPKKAPPKAAEKPKAAPKTPEKSKPAAAKAELKPLEVSTLITVRELAEKMSIRPNELIKKLMIQGVFATINQRLDSETAVLVSHDYGFDLKVKQLHMEEEIVGKAAEEERPEDLKPRPPVVTVMGHVDHGKTKLLDAIRDANVAAGEAGGITQHIGAYKVQTPKGNIVFLDTPGHEAFTAMRSRGAKATDIVILVVSAADGVQPQTVEAIDHAKEAQVPIIVAVNKIDLPQADPQRVRQDLAKRGLSPEEWGGKHIFVDISAKKKQNIEKLLEMILLQSEMLELKANPERAAAGTVIEAKFDARRGALATVLVQKGTLRIGDPFVMGLSGGKVKALVTDKGDRIKSAGPATPVEVMGLSGGIPQAGDSFTVVENERTAKEIVEKRNRVHREEALAHRQHVSLLDIKSGVRKELPVVLKADVQGSLEVLKDSLEKLSTPEITVRVIHSGLGAANESDVLLAGASDAVILLFHVDSDNRSRELAEKDGVEIWKYDVIYELTSDVKAALEGLLEPEQVEVKAGRVEIQQEFKIRGARIAGCMVVDGKAVRGAKLKVFRGRELVGEGTLETLRRFKDEAKQVEKGLECGISITGFDAWKTGDQLEVHVKEKRVRRLESAV